MKLQTALAALMIFAPLSLPAQAGPKDGFCPPGLAKKDPPCIPPGLARKGARGDGDHDDDDDHDHDHDDDDDDHDHADKDEHEDRDDDDDNDGEVVILPGDVLGDEEAVYEPGDVIEDNFTLVQSPERYRVDPDHTYVRSKGLLYRVNPETLEIVELMGATSFLLKE